MIHLLHLVLVLAGCVLAIHLTFEWLVRPALRLFILKRLHERNWK